MAADEDPAQGDEYHHADGTVEIVFAVEAGRVLTVKEYPNTDSFVGGTSNAKYKGLNQDIIDLPPAETFGQQDDTNHSDDSSTNECESESNS